MGKKDCIKNIKIKRIKSHTNIFSELFLKRQGKKDGKNGIPFNYSGDEIISPNIKKEHDKIYSYMAYMLKMISNYNAYYYHEFQALFAEFDSKTEDAKKIIDYLQDKPSEINLYISNLNSTLDFEKYLSSKRKSEEGLDNIVIRQRRFEEYQNRLLKYRTMFKALSEEIDEIYKKIVVCFDVLKRTFELFEPMFWEACSVIDIRLSWYWQGVLLKHSQAEKLLPVAPIPSCRKYNEYIKAKTDEIERLKEIIQNKYHDFKKL